MAPKEDSSYSEYKLEEEEDEDSPKRRRIGGSNKNQKYSVVSYEMRLKLIRLSEKKGYSISKAARELGIKASTGKFIVKLYRDTGKIMRKKALRPAKLNAKNQEASKVKVEQTEKWACKEEAQDFNNEEAEEKVVPTMLPSFCQDYPQFPAFTEYPEYQDHQSPPMFGYPLPPPPVMHTVMPPYSYYPSYSAYSGMMMPGYYS